MPALGGKSATKTVTRQPRSSIALACRKATISAPPAPATESAVEQMFPARETAEAFALALFLGGVPVAGKTTARRQASRRLELFDLVDERFEASEPGPEPCDLPPAGHSDQGSVDWIAVN